MRGARSKKRRTVLIVVLAILAALFLWLQWGNTSLQTTHIRLQSTKIPISFNGFTIAQVSDLHNAEFGRGQHRLLDAIRKASPDLIAVTGDLIDAHHTDVGKAMEFINGAVRIAPVYYVTGNNEAETSAYAALQEQMIDAGVVLLRNTGIEIDHEGGSILLLGLDDPDFTTMGDSAQDSAVVVDAELKKIPRTGGRYTILLSHRPELLDVYAANGIDLVLSGHAHGGQIRLPFVGGLVAPDQGLFPRYTQGVYTEDQTSMVVSRGLGNSVFPLRINDRPELTVITLIRH